MRFKLEINCDNAAFEQMEQEVSSILDDLSHRIYNGERFDRTVLRDSNGNAVGVAEFIE